MRQCKKCGHLWFSKSFASARSRHCFFCIKATKLYNSIWGRLVYSDKDCYRKLSTENVVAWSVFLGWCRAELPRFHKKWPNAAPSIDRINPTLGYGELSNLRIIPKQLNCGRTSKSRFKEWATVDKVRRLRRAGWKVQQIADLLECSIATVSRCANFETYLDPAAFP